ncbi:MerR family transcriptional regulator [Helicovermis profundi]|uniref:GyrI-like domain-containing protein n=1 Tax=Helicovermis profundi TaxID=3065157 RepID=A0AAU9EBW5_9FIRM|nr:GyrI-like domain-containing protein [Clostridia bacterium S502]
MKDKFLIGELAKLCNISTDTLRHYDKLGLFKPQYDNKNNYRYYDIRSLFKLSRILFLKNLDISLNEIKDYMNNKNTDNLKNMLRKKETEIDFRIHQLTNLKSKIQSKLELLDSFKTEVDQIKIKTINKRYGIFMDMNELKNESEIKQAFKKSENYLKISSWLIEGQIYTSLSKKNMDNAIFDKFRYFIEIDSIEEETNNHLTILSKQEYACLIVLGPYQDMITHYQKLVEWIKSNDYEIAGDSIEKNIIDYDFSDYELEYVSEIQIPIKKLPTKI